MRFFYIILSIILLSSLSYSSSIKNSKHNLSAGLNSICLNCHVPHNTTKKQPLWYKNFNNEIKFQQVYSSQSIEKSKTFSSFTKNSVSLFCLSCHDIGKLETRSEKNKIFGNHPINFKTKNIGEKNNNDGSPCIVIDYKKFPLYDVVETLDGIEGYVECPSCHSVHDNLNPPFLRETMNESRLCLGCHNK